MKKTLLFLAFIVSTLSFAQTNGITYQAVIYSINGESVPGINNSNAPLANKNICLQFSIVDDFSQTEYQEKVTVTTDDYGMVNLIIGTGTQTGGYANSFESIVWNSAKKYLKVSLDQSGKCNSFDEISNQVLSYVPFALAANSTTSVSGIVGIANGGTNATTITGAKTNLQLQNVDNTRDLDKPIATLTQTALNSKVDKVVGKELSSNDYSTAEKTKLAAISGVNTGDQDLSSYATSTTTTTALALKVDKVSGKELSSNDFSTAEKTKLAAISGVNTGDQDLSSFVTATALTNKVDKVTGKELSTNDYTTAEKTKLAAISGVNTGDQDLSSFVTATALTNKVDKVAGKELSSNDYTTVEKSKLAAITGNNTGDQDLSLYATTTSVVLKANAADVTSGLATKVDKVTGKELSSNDYTTDEKTKLAAISGNNTGDQDLSLYATTTSVALKANAADVTSGLATKVDKVTGKELSSNDYTTDEKTKLAAISGTNTGDQDLSSFATTTDLIAKENSLNKSLDITLSDATNTKFPTELAVKTFVENKLLNTSAVASQIIEGAVWITPTTGTLNGVSFVLSNSQSSGTSNWDLSNTDFSAAPLSETQNLTEIVVSDDWSITFDSPITDLRLYSKYWRAANYTFDNAFSILSGSGLSSNGNILTVTGWGNGIIQFSSPITSLTVNSSEGSNNQSSQIMTFGGEFTTPLNSGSGEVARLESPIFSGVPTAPTATPGTSTTQIATTAFVTNATTGKFVDITTNQTIAGTKTFNSDITINGLTIGKGIGQVNDQNITVGQNTLTNNTTGQHLIALGGGTLQSNTSANYNIGIGSSALFGNSTGENNIAIGAAALAFNNGSNNTAIGLSASLLGNSLTNVTGIGYQAGMNNTGSTNTFLGANTDQTTASTSVTNSTAIGYGAKISAANQIQLGNTNVTNVNTSGNVTASGFKTPTGTSSQYLMADGSVSIASSSTSVPYTGATASVDLGIYDISASRLIGTDIYGGRINDINIGIKGTGETNYLGTSALAFSSGGFANTAIGHFTLTETQGDENTAIGAQAMRSSTTGSRNTAVGRASLNGNLDGNNNTALGYDTRVSSPNLENTTAIGAGAIVDASNTIQFGNTSVTNVKTSGTITAGTITYPNTSGTNGQVLMTNGSGNASWGSVLNYVQKITDMTSSNAIVASRISIGGVTFQYSLNSGVGGKIQIFTNSTQEYQVLHSKNSGTTGNSFSTPLSNSIPVDLCNQTLTYYDHLSVDFFRVNSGMGNSFHLDAFVDGWGRLVMRITYF